MTALEIRKDRAPLLWGSSGHCGYYPSPRCFENAPYQTLTVFVIGDHGEDAAQLSAVEERGPVEDFDDIGEGNRIPEQALAEVLNARGAR